MMIRTARPYGVASGIAAGGQPFAVRASANGTDGNGSGGRNSNDRGSGDGGFEGNGSGDDVSNGDRQPKRPFEGREEEDRERDAREEEDGNDETDVRESSPAVAVVGRIREELFAADASHLSTPLYVLIVDEDTSVRKACAEIVSGMGFHPIQAESVSAARTLLGSQPVDLVLLDLKPGAAGLVLLEEIGQHQPNTIVIVMTAFASVNSAVEAMRSGAGDLLTKPFSVEQLTDVLRRSAQRRVVDREARDLRERIRASGAAGMGPLIGRSPAMEKLYRMLSKVAFTTHPVLILGESGTGKEVVARMIHAHGPQANRPFIPVDCGSLVPTLIESELFGHVKGAFTGAMRAKEGLLAAAGNGTVFLDEIGELPMDLQAKLLRALQEREVRPVGATYSVPIGARILAATNQDLPTMVANGRFRKDLYFRLNVVNIQLPPLRERKGDIPMLATHALERLARHTGKRIAFSDDALRVLNDYTWPGNVRELEHAVEHAVALSSGPILHRADFPPEMQNFRPQRSASGVGDEGGAGDDGSGVHKVITIAELEKQAILNAIQIYGGDKLTAAKMLGIGKTTLYRKLKEYGIDPGSMPEE